jgi:hypothetical protein
MKVVWDETDVVPGQRVARSDKTEQFIIGYRNGAARDSNFALVSLADGMVMREGTAAYIMEMLNGSSFQPSELIERPRRARNSA